jgi:hypothetical protein
VETDILIQLDSHIQEVRGNRERCDEIVSMVTEYAYTVIECLADLYTAGAGQRLESLKAELESFQKSVTPCEHDM